MNDLWNVVYKWYYKVINYRLKYAKGIDKMKVDSLWQY